MQAAIHWREKWCPGPTTQGRPDSIRAASTGRTTSGAGTETDGRSRWSTS